MIVIGLPTVLFVCLAGVFIWWQKNIASKNVSTKIPIQVNQQNKIAESFVAATKSDQDFDGLGDQDEKKYGTNPTLADTDQDGLLDKDEIDIYKTDPLKEDTYGIGHPDGWAVQRGIILPNGKIDQNKLKNIKNNF